ncbi:MAG: S-layer homology domain-containing protein [Oscillospiraceae bacterium]|nr:S-layer homology domain-containing protein [Oscillospiraceae bacterium]
MKTGFNRFVALACAVVMLFSFAGTAFAAEEPTKTPITIKTLDPASGEVTFNGVADGDDVSVDFDKIEMELYGHGISTEVTEANVCEYPYDAEAEKVYDTYTVNYDKEQNAVIIEMTNLVPHKNAQGKVAFWTGFAVKAPEGAASFNYEMRSRYGFNYSDGYDIELETIDANGTRGVAFYFDANAKEPVDYVSLQWLDENDEPVSDWESAYIDISSVECYEKKGEVVKANVRDFYDDTAVYGSYSVAEKDGIVTIGMDSLRMHTNANDDEGYWTGFAVKAPEGADTFDYIIDNGWYTVSESQTPAELEVIDENGAKGVAFYLDAEYAGYDYESEERFYNVSLQWYDAEGAPLSAWTYYYADVTDVELYELKGTVGKANVRDYHDDFSVYTSYNVTEKNGTVEISMDDLLMHKSSDDNANKPAFWTGFAVAVPEGHDEIKSFNYSIRGRNSDSYGDDVALETIEANGTQGVAFYLDAEDAMYDHENDKRFFDVSLQWCDENGAPLSAWTYYHVDVTDVNCKYFDRPVMAAKLEDKADTPKTELYTKYEVKNEGGWVVITAQDLEKHENGEGTDGYWAGFAVEAPEGATKFAYDFGYTSSNGIIDVELLDTDVYGAAFYLDAGDIDAKDYVRIEWYREDGTPYDGETYYYPIDFTGVDLAIENEFDVAATVKAAPISDKNNPEKELLTEENTDSYTAVVDGNTIKLSATGLRAHINGEGDRGAWVGVKFDEAPVNAAYAKYAFAGEAAVKHMWNGTDLTLAPEEASFYVNVFDPEAKNSVMLQWFDVDGKALTNIKTYKIDTTGVACDVKGEQTVIEIAPAVDQTESGPSDIAPYFGENTAELSGNVITLGADCLFMHNNAYMENGAWIGFTAKVAGAAYVRYAFSNDYYSELNWQYDAQEAEVDGEESFYVNASAYRPKDKLIIQWFDENGDALTNVNTYDINIEKVDWSDIRYFDVLFSNIKLIGADAADYELADDEYVEEKSSRDYVYAYANVYGNGTVTNNGKVWIRDKDYSDGITKNNLIAKADSGYEFTGWWDYALDYYVEMATTYVIEQDKCYALEVVFKEKTVAPDSGNVGGGGTGGLTAGGAGGKKEDKDEDKDKEDVKLPEQTAPSTGLSFGDVSANAWYFEDVKTAVEKGLMNGVTATKFDPNGSLTRAMFVTILYRAAGEPAIGAMSDFADVPVNQYYANAVAWASANGIVNGVSEGKFAPNASITREQMAAIIHRYGKASGITPASDNDVSYTDADKISAYAKDAAKWAYNAGIILGNADGSFAPSRTASRAEAATIFVRLLSLMQ